MQTKRFIFNVTSGGETFSVYGYGNTRDNAKLALEREYLKDTSIEYKGRNDFEESIFAKGEEIIADM